MKTVSWLPPQARDWVDLYGYFLDGIWTRFEQDGKWPDPVEVQRELRCADPSRRVTQAMERMPPFFTRQEHVPPEISLTIFGLGCCDAARPLLEQYLDVARLALQRFDSPALPNRLSREDVVAELELSAAEADRLSVVLNRYALFLGSGDVSVGSWDREVHPQAEEFEGIEDVDHLLDFLARKQRLADLGQAPSVPVPFATSPAPAPAPPQSSDSFEEKLKLAGTLTSATVAVITLALVLASSPSALGLALVGFFGGLATALMLLRQRPVWGVGLIVALTAIGGLAGMTLDSEGSSGPFQYFVASTGEEAVVIPRIEPNSEAPMSRDHVLGSGSSVQVECIMSNREGRWAKLVDGTFVPARLLAPEVGGAAAPNC